MSDPHSPCFSPLLSSLSAPCFFSPLLATCPLPEYHPAVLFLSHPILSRARMCTGSHYCQSKCVTSWWRRWSITASGQEAGTR